MASYKCLSCGSTSGVPCRDRTENWWWLNLIHGRVGPFCQHSHALGFTIHGTSVDVEPRFTLEEHTALIALQHRYEEGM